MENPKSEVISRKEVEAQLEELTKLIQVSPRLIAKKKRMGKDSISNTAPDNIQDLLNFLRVGIKYQLFDLNAYRLEIDYLCKLCKENNIDV